MLLSIITLTVEGREESLKRLADKVTAQVADLDPLLWAPLVGPDAVVEHLIVPGPGVYGRKMRHSLEQSKGDYVCWVDDDDDIADNYVSHILNAIEYPEYPDVVTFGSDMVGHRKMWLHANKQDNSGEYDGGQVWCANHYCAWKREIALSATWLPRNYGSETAWYKLICMAYPHLKEHHIHEFLHIYNYNPKTTLCQDKKSIEASLKDDCDDVTLLRLPGGKLGIAVGRWQPVKRKYTAILPDYKFETHHENNVDVLGRFRYE